MSGIDCRCFLPSPHPPTPTAYVSHSLAVFLPFASVWERKGNGCYAGYAVLKTQNLDMIVQLKYMPIVINPVRIALSEWES